MKRQVFLGVDQGSGSSKGILLGLDGEELDAFSAEVPAIVQDGEKIEQDAEGILASVEKIFDAALAACTAKGFAITGAGLALQRSGVLAWSRDTGSAQTPMLTWADGSTRKTIESIGSTRSIISQKTGLPVIPNFAAGKIALLQNRFSRATSFVGTLDTFLLYRLSEHDLFVTEDTMAARTMLYSLKTREWDEELVKLFRVDLARLPKVRPSLSTFTMYKGVPIVASLGDQQAALFGRMRQERYPLMNLGTIASVLVETGDAIVQKPGLMTSVLYSWKGSRPPPPPYDREYEFLSELTNPVAGTLLHEVVSRHKLLPALDNLSEICDEDRKNHPSSRALAYTAAGRAVPPHWSGGVPDVVVNLQSENPATLARALVENVGNHIISLLDQLLEYGLIDPTRCEGMILVAGGGSEVGYLLQYISDCSGFIFGKLENRNAGARGAALAAHKAVDTSLDVRSLNKQPLERTYIPGDRERRRRYLAWKKLEHDLLSGRVPDGAKIVSR